MTLYENNRRDARFREWNLALHWKLYMNNKHIPETCPLCAMYTDWMKTKKNTIVMKSLKGGLVWHL